MRGIKESVRETLMSVGPVIIIILLLQTFLAPMPSELMGRFIAGTLFLIMGLSIFGHGVRVGMEPMGEEIGSGMAKSRRLLTILVGGFVIGFIVTLAEPDLQVLTSQVGQVSDGAISPAVLLLSVGVGVGVMTAIALLRILLQVPLRYVLWLSYAVIFALAAVAPPEYVPVSFDSGGVTTGPMTVPFIMSLGIGVSSIRSDRTAEEDSFGLVGLVSAGPIIAVLILGVLTK